MLRPGRSARGTSRDGEIYRNAGEGFELEEFGIVFETPNPNQAYYPEDYKRDADPVLLCFHVLVTLNVTFILMALLIYLTGVRVQWDRF